LSAAPKLLRCRVGGTSVFRQSELALAQADDRRAVAASSSAIPSPSSLASLASRLVVRFILEVRLQAGSLGLAVSICLIARLRLHQEALVIGIEM